MAEWRLPVGVAEGVTRDGAAALDARMLEVWWSAIYPDWTLWH
jgi:hypothetical protein